MDNREAHARATMDALYALHLRRQQTKKSGDADGEWLCNVSQFALLWNFDLTSLTHAITSLKNESGTFHSWQRQQQARVLALTMAECVQSFLGLLGRRTREIIVRRHGVQTPLLDELNELHGRLVILHRAHNAHWRRLRNTIIAHRDEDAEVQLEAMRDTRIDDIQQQGWTFITWTTDLVSWLSRVRT